MATIRVFLNRLRNIHHIFGNHSVIKWKLIIERDDFIFSDDKDFNKCSRQNFAYFNTKRKYEVFYFKTTGMKRYNSNLEFRSVMRLEPLI